MGKALALALGVIVGLVGCGDGKGPATPDQGTVKVPDAPAAPLDPNAKPYPLKVCIVSGEPLGSMGEPPRLTYKGQEFKLCCKGCEKTFYADPEKHLAKLAAAAPK